MLQIPEPEDVLVDLRDLTPLLYLAMESGVHHARDYFERNDQVPDPWLFSHLVRYQAKQILTDSGYSVEELEVDNLANSGLSLSTHGYPIRIRKGDHGAPPAPQSHSLHDFYVQGRLPFGSGGPDDDKPNLVVLWDVDRPAYNMTSSLVLACPAGVSGTDVPCHWKVPIPQVAAATPPSTPDPTQPVDDLDLQRLDDDADTETGQLRLP
jgi:hypothetical protein